MANQFLILISSSEIIMLHSSGSAEYLIFRNMYLVCTIGKDALFVNNTAAMYVAVFIC